LARSIRIAGEIDEKSRKSGPRPEALRRMRKTGGPEGCIVWL